jgi:Zn finger protein HypA/HybF involved in hydrogenase expression
MSDAEKAIYTLKNDYDIKTLHKKYNATRQAIDLAILALEKQTAKKIQRIKINDRNIDFKCPSCNKFVAYEFCLDCGQKLDWGD